MKLVVKLMLMLSTAPLVCPTFVPLVAYAEAAADACPATSAWCVAGHRVVVGSHTHAISLALL
jgi:hypothetical protein